MKFKFLSFTFALVVAIALASCGGDTVKPTGDVEKDVQAFKEYIQKVDVKNAAAVTEATKVYDEFTKYYSDEGAGKELKDKWTETYEKELKGIYDKFTEDTKNLVEGAVSGAVSGASKPAEESKS